MRLVSAVPVSICNCMLLNHTSHSIHSSGTSDPHLVARVLLREPPRDAMLAVLPARKAGCRGDCDLLPSCIRCSCFLVWAALVAIQCLA